MFNSADITLKEENTSEDAANKIKVDTTKP